MTDRRLQVGVLGPVEVVRGGERIPIGSQRQRSVLGVLVASLGSVISTDRLIDDVWGSEAAPDRQNALWVHISNLRRVIERDPASPEVLRTRSPGYFLDGDLVDVDVRRFESLVAEGRAFLETDPEAASSSLSHALGLWRGRAYEDFTYDEWAQPEIARLGELRLEAVELRVDADLRRGLDSELVAELESLVRTNPTRERLTASLMLALHRSGRQAEALRAYAALAGRLADELGVEPSKSLQELEERIVLQDASLMVETAAKPESGLTIRGYEVRGEIARRPWGSVHRAFQASVGREVAIEVVTGDIADDPDFIRRFESRLRAIHTIEHPHIVPLYDHWREPGAAYMVTRLVQAEPLADRIAEGRSGLAEAVAVADAIASAVAAVHRLGVGLGGVSADQVLLDDDGNAFLSDAFGSLARDADPDPATDVQSIGFLVAASLAGRAGTLSELLVGLDPAVAAVLQEASDLDAVSLRHRLLGALGADAQPVVLDENPYKALRSFDVADAKDFFGRERFVERVVSRLSRAGPQGRFVAVVGPSGSGKSSVVKAGVLPALAAGAAPGSEDWFTTIMTPGDHPFEELESALMAVAVGHPTSLLEMVLSESGIARAVERVLPGDGTLVLVLDQLEELFTHAAPDEAERFLDALADAVVADRSPVRVITTLRADFYDRPLRHQAMGELLRVGTEVLTPMSAEELERAVSGPATRVGAVVEPALVSEIVAAVADRPGALPLFQYALTEVFERRDGNRLRLDDYRALGGVSGALVDRAEAIHRDLGDSAAVAAREVFLRLVSLGEGSGDTRRRVLVSELQAMHRHAAEVMSVVETFGRHRLLTFDRDLVTRTPTVEIAHEALLTAWDRLAAWIEDARSDIRAERRLAEAVAEWVARDRSDDFTLGGGRLARYASWLSAPPVALTAAEGEFLQASVRVDEERRRAEAEASRAEELLRRRSRTLLALGVITVLIAALGVFAVIQRQRATDLADGLTLSDEARRLAASATIALETDPELSLLLAIESARVTADGTGEVLPESMDAIHWALSRLRVQYPDDVEAVAVRPGVGGVFLLDPDELVDLAEVSATRRLSPDECDRYGVDGCSETDVVDGLELAGGVDAYASTADGLAGTRVIITTPETGGSLEAAIANFADFTRRTGIVVEVRNQRLDQTALSVAAGPTDEDIVVLPQPAAIRTVLDDGGPLIDLSHYIDREALEDAWSPYLTSLVSVGSDGSWPSRDGPVYGVWTRFDVKSLLWFHDGSFDPDGPPSDWDTLLRSLGTDDRSACLYISSGAGTGWPATDVVESLVIRAAGVEVYDQWVSHEIPFDHPAIVDAISRLDALVHGEGMLAEGPVGSREGFFFGNGVALESEEPGCNVTPMPSWLPQTWGNGEPEHSSVVPFPAVDDGSQDAVLGGGAFAVALSDRPEVREVVRFMAGPEFGLGGSGVAPGYIPPNRNFDVDTIPSPLGQQVASILYPALGQDQFRFDASDLMPSAIGADLFFEGMRDLFSGEPGRAEQIASRIEASWGAIDSGCTDPGFDGYDVGLPECGA